MFRHVRDNQRVRPHITKHVEAWLPVICVRSTVAKQITGGAANVVRTFVRRMFAEDKISTKGVLVQLGASASGTAAMYFKLGNLVLDGDAARIVFSHLGANANLPCMNCLNVLQLRGNSVGMPQGVRWSPLLGPIFVIARQRR